MAANAILVSDKDNVVVVTKEVKQGDIVNYFDSHGNVHSLRALENITIYHKVAISDISTKDPVKKYGERIGIALKNISAGEHVHEHNLISGN